MMKLIITPDNYVLKRANGNGPLSDPTMLLRVDNGLTTTTVIIRAVTMLKVTVYDQMTHVQVGTRFKLEVDNAVWRDIKDSITAAALGGWY